MPAPLQLLDLGLQLPFELLLLRGRGGFVHFLPDFLKNFLALGNRFEDTVDFSLQLLCRGHCLWLLLVDFSNVPVPKTLLSCALWQESNKTLMWTF